MSVAAISPAEELASSSDIEEVRAQFPIFSQKVNGHPLVFLDSAASAQKPLCVLQAIESSIRQSYANVHRGAYRFSEDCTTEFEATRETVRNFLGAGRAEEIIFTASATNAINLVAYSFSEAFIGEGDEILITGMEHHANLVPWQLAAKRTGAKLKVAPIDGDGNLRLDEFTSMLNARTKLVAFAHVSNVLGTINPIKEMTRLAHKAGAKVLIDGSQAAPHIRLDMKDIGCDFYVFTGHKVYGPTGIGVLYGKYELLCDLPPFLSGGEMIDRVSYTGTSFALPPARFEAGTPPILEAFALKAAIEFMQNTGLESIASHEQKLTYYAHERLETIDGLTIYGKAAEKGPVVTFTVDGIHPHDLAMMLDQQGIAVRTGLHCAEPLHEFLGISGSTRASFGVYNRFEDIDRLVEGVEKSIKLLRD